MESFTLALYTVGPHIQFQSFLHYQSPSFCGKSGSIVLMRQGPMLGEVAEDSLDLRPHESTWWPLSSSSLCVSGSCMSMVHQGQPLLEEREPETWLMLVAVP